MGLCMSINSLLCIPSPWDCVRLLIVYCAYLGVCLLIVCCRGIAGIPFDCCSQSVLLSELRSPLIEASPTRKVPCLSCMRRRRTSHHNIILSHGTLTVLSRYTATPHAPHRPRTALVQLVLVFCSGVVLRQSSAMSSSRRSVVLRGKPCPFVKDKPCQPVLLGSLGGLSFANEQNR